MKIIIQEKNNRFTAKFINCIFLPLLVFLSFTLNLFSQSVDLSYAKLQDTELSEAALQSGNFYKTNLQRVIFHGGASLQDAVFSYVNLQSTWMPNSQMQNTSIIESNMIGTELYEANLQCILVKNTNLQSSMLSRSWLQNAYFKNVNLKNSSLYKTNFAGVLLENCNLQSAKISNTLFIGELEKYVVASHYRKRESDKKLTLVEYPVSFQEEFISSWTPHGTFESKRSVWKGYAEAKNAKKSGNIAKIDIPGILFIRTKISGKLPWLFIEMYGNYARPILMNYQAHLDNKLKKLTLNHTLSPPVDGKIVKKINNLKNLTFRSNSAGESLHKHGFDINNKILLEEIFNKKEKKTVVIKKIDTWLGLELNHKSAIHNEKTDKIDLIHINDIKEFTDLNYEAKDDMKIPVIENLPKLVFYGKDTYDRKSKIINLWRTAWMDVYTYNEWKKLVADKRESWTKMIKKGIKMKPHLKILNEFEKEIDQVNLIPDDSYCQSSKEKMFLKSWLDKNFNTKHSSPKGIDLATYQKLWRKRLNWKRESLVTEIKLAIKKIKE